MNFVWGEKNLQAYRIAAAPEPKSKRNSTNPSTKLSEMKSPVLSIFCPLYRKSPFGLFGFMTINISQKIDPFSPNPTNCKCEVPLKDGIRNCVSTEKRLNYRAFSFERDGEKNLRISQNSPVNPIENRLVIKH